MVSAFVAWFVHVKSISLVDAALAVRLLGAAGVEVEVEVVAVATLE